MPRLRMALLALPFLACAACHGEVQMIPLIDRKIYLTDKFYDVQAISADRAIVVGYGGKILETRDSGRTWNLRPSGTDNALYKIHLVDGQTGWVVGQAGTILRTTNGGESWTQQTSGTDSYLFSVYALSPDRAIAVGDKAGILQTTDGGNTWKNTKYQQAKGTMTADEELAAQDPSLYDIVFVDDKTGWIVGEFGKILKTTDGGATWTEQQGSLMGGEITNPLDLPTFYGARFVNAQEGIASGIDAHIAHTRDGGAKWAFDEVSPDVTMPLFQPLLFPDGSGWAVGASGTVVRRESPDAPWKAADLGLRVLSWVRQVSFVDRDNGWLVGGFGTILHTRDGGKTWLPAAA